jgi:hydrogenase maturation protease
VTAPVLVFGYGNPSRGDDALGPEFVRRLEALAPQGVADGHLEVLTDFQLQVEHALDLKGRRQVFFVDASVGPGGAFEVKPVGPVRDSTFSSHLLSPQALLHTWVELERCAPPEAWLYAIRGERFELGEPLSAGAERNLEAALSDFLGRWTALSVAQWGPRA